jgi:hypothetical protein
MTEGISELDHIKHHDNFIQQLHSKGCEYGRTTWNETKKLEADYKSDLGSVRAGQNLFINEIFPKMQDGVRDAKQNTEAALAAVKEAKKAVVDMRKSMWAIFVSLFLMVAATIWGNLAKLGQDSRNQVETASYLKELTLAMTALESRLNRPPQMR